MFLHKFVLSPEGDVAGNTAAPSSVPTSSPVNSSDTSAVASTSDLFAGFEDKYFSGKETDDDAFNDIDNGYNRSTDGESIDETFPENTGETEEPVEADSDKDLPLFIFKDKINNEDVELVIEDEKQLNHYLRRAAVAPKVYEENKRLKQEMESYKDKVSVADEFERMSKEEPLELLNLIVEDMDESQLGDWVRGLSDVLQQSQEQREYFKKLREAEYIRQQWGKQKEAEKKLETQRQHAIEEENIKVVHNWRSNEFSKWKSKIPQENHDILQQIIDDQLLYASNMANSGQDVDLTQLSSRLFKYAQALIGSQKSIQQKVGKATIDARKTATNKLQAAASQARTSRNAPNSAGTSQFKSTNEMFDFLSKKIGTGEIKLKG